MKGRCINIKIVEAKTITINRISKDEKDCSIGEGGYFRNLGCGKGLVTYAGELLLRIDFGGQFFLIPITKQFRDKFTKPGRISARLTEKRISRIKATMPGEVDVIEVKDVRYPYRVANTDIDAWFLKL